MLFIRPLIVLALLCTAFANAETDEGLQCAACKGICSSFVLPKIEKAWPFVEEQFILACRVGQRGQLPCEDMSKQIVK
jgi:hypothetical protein